MVVKCNSLANATRLLRDMYGAGISNRSQYHPYGLLTSHFYAIDPPAIIQLSHAEDTGTTGTGDH